MILREGWRRKKENVKERKKEWEWKKDRKSIIERVEENEILRKIERDRNIEIKSQKEKEWAWNHSSSVYTAGKHLSFYSFYPAVTLGENLKGKQCKSLNLAFENIGVKKAGSRKGTWNFAILDQFYLSEKKVFFIFI